MDNLPPIDFDRLAEYRMNNGGDDEFDSQEQWHAAEEAGRREYLSEAMDMALSLRELQSELPSSRDKAKNSYRERKIGEIVRDLPTHLYYSEQAYGRPTADFLRAELASEAGLQFTDNFEITPGSLEAPIYTQETNMAKATAAKAPIADVTADAPERSIRYIPLSQVVVSPFETQARRRARFSEDEITELASDIARNDMIQAIAVRPTKVGKKEAFEIVAGERRYLAVKLLKRQTIAATVEQLTDEQAFEIQQSENKQRKDLHPLDQAFAYQIMQERFGHDIHEIAIREGKGAPYVATRLKLLNLGPAALQAFEENKILLGHALEIAKQPQAHHPELLRACYSSRGLATESLLSVRVFIEHIQSEFLHRLDQAPFSTKAKNLRPDGLACVDCPARTGANPMLFTEDYNPKDQCLDAACWGVKSNAHIQIQRAKVVLPEQKDIDPFKLSKTVQDQVSEIPLVAGEYCYGPDLPRDFVRYNTFTELKRSDECENGKTGVFFNGGRRGQKIYFCNAPRCKTHAGKYRSDSGLTDDEKREGRLNRKEELFDMHVAEAVRRIVFDRASAKFAKQYVVKNGGDSFLPQLLGKLWSTSTSGEDSHNRSRIVETLLTEWQPDFDGRGHMYNQDEATKRLEKLPRDVQIRLLFLFVHANKGCMVADNYRSQDAVRRLAKEYDIDGQVLDAEQRLVHAMAKHKKHIEHFRQYLAAIKAGKLETPIPRVFSETYRPKD